MSQTKSRQKVLIIAGAALVVLLAAYLGVRFYIDNAATYMVVTPHDIYAPKGGGDIIVDIDYDGYVWSVDNVPEWLKVDKYKAAFSLTALPNKTGRDRKATLVVSSGRYSDDVTVSQAGRATQIMLSKYMLWFDEDGGEEEVLVQSDGCQWECDYPKFLELTAELDGTVRIKAKRNRGERQTGQIIFHEDDVKSIIKVSQAGICPTCHGEGELTCTLCEGTGRYGFGFLAGPCWTCGGYGKMMCSTCFGSGKAK